MSDLNNHTPPYSQQLSVKLRLLTISCFIALFILECGTRIYLCGFDSLWPPIMNSIHDIGTSGAIQASEYPEIIYELKPNLDILFKKVRLRTNPEGLPDKEYAKQKAPNAFRVAVIGDSYTMPTGVAIENAYHSLLEDRLARDFPEKKIEFINFAVGGYQLRQYAAVIRYKAVLYHPDLVLIGFCLANDANPLPEGVFKKKYQPLRQTWPFFTLHFIRLLRETAARVSNSLNQTGHDSAALDQNKMVYIDKYFAEAERLANANHFGVLIAALNNKPSDPVLSSFLQKMSQKHHFWFLDVTQPFKNTDHRKFSITREDGHPNEKAHRLFADQLYPFLKEIISDTRIS